MCFVRSVCPSLCLPSVRIHEDLSSLSLKHRQKRAGPFTPSPRSVHDRRDFWLSILPIPCEAGLCLQCSVSAASAGRGLQRGRGGSPAEGMPTGHQTSPLIISSSRSSKEVGTAPPTLQMR